MFDQSISCLGAIHINWLTIIWSNVNKWMRFRAASITKLIHNSPYCPVWFSFILWPAWPVWKRFLISFCVELKTYKNLDKLFKNPVYISCALPCPLFSMFSHSILLSFILSHIYSPAKPSPLILSRRVFSLVSVTVPNTAKIYSLSVPLSFPLKRLFFKKILMPV